MRHEYKTAFANTPELLDMLVNTYLEQSWDLWGNPYALVCTIPSESLTLPILRFFQVVVRHIHPSSVVEKVEIASINEPAGYTVQVPETPKIQTRANGSVFEEAIPLFRGQLCCCYEKVGDNLDCWVHFPGRIPNLVN
jgi:hypothetical protein